MEFFSQSMVKSGFLRYMFSIFLSLNLVTLASMWLLSNVTNDGLFQVIAAEGEQKASRALREAAETIADSHSALQVSKSRPRPFHRARSS